MAKYINPTKIIDLINRAKIQYYKQSYQNLLNEEYGLDDLTIDIELLGLIRLLIKCLEYEFSLSQSSEITYNLYVKLAKLINKYDTGDYSINTGLQYSIIIPIYVGGSGLDEFIELIDTPDTYTGQAGKVVVVNNSETGLVFTTIQTTVPTTFIPVTIGNTDQEVILTWSDVSAIHGTRPVFIDLYSNGVQTTSRVYTEDSGVTYRWFVGTASPRTWEIRLMGYYSQATSGNYATPGYVADGYWQTGLNGL